MCGNVSRVIDMGNLQKVLLANLRMRDLPCRWEDNKLNLKNWNVRALAGLIRDFTKMFSGRLMWISDDSVQWRAHVDQ
jgi:hypothetical protein